MDSFPLLRLPTVTLRETLKCFNPIELIELSHCSKNVAKQIKQIPSTQHFQLKLDFCCKSVGITTKREDYDFPIWDKDISNIVQEKIKVRIKKRKYYAGVVEAILDHNSENVTYMFWNGSRRFTSLMDFCSHISNIFNCPIYSMNTGSQLSINELWAIINWISERQSEIQKLDIWVKGIELSNILDKLEVNLELSSYYRPEFSKEFQNNFPHGLPKMITFWNSSWFKLQNLLATKDCVRIELIDSSLTNEDIGVYLEKWKTGSYPSLEHFRVESDQLSDEQPIAGIQPPIRSLEDPNRRVFKAIDNYRPRIIGGLDIRRNDGVVGTIKLENRNIMIFSLLVLN